MVENKSYSSAEFLHSVIDANRKGTLEVTNELDKEELWQYFLYAALGFVALALIIY